MRIAPIQSLRVLLAVTTATMSILLSAGCPSGENPTAPDAMCTFSQNQDHDITSEEQRDRLLEHRAVVLDGPIEDQNSLDLIARLLYLDHRSAAQPIQLYVNSPGGSVTSGLAIIDTMDHVSSPIHTYCYGRAEGMAAFIVAHGEKGHRVASPNASFSLSDPWVNEGKGSSAEKRTEEVKRCKAIMSEMLAGDIGKPAADVAQAMTEQARFDATEAKEYNLVDEVAVCHPVAAITD